MGDAERQQEASGGLASDYDYHLPEELVAAHPAARRDESRLMVLPPDAAAPPLHRTFRDIVEHLRAGDLLVANDSRVLPARIYGRRVPGGGACEVLLLRPHAPAADGSQRWSALARPGKKLKAGARIEFAPDFHAAIESDLGDGEKLLRFDCAGDFRSALDRHGSMPLPPYILARRGERGSTDEDRERYQTVYAEPEGSVAAPTAGLHFTEDLLARIAALGVEFRRVTLHVGAGTFQPIATERIDEHRMHSEVYEVPAATADAIARARREGRRVIAVGTTTVRTLETAALADGTVRPGGGESTLMIKPGFRLQVVDGLVTNFHLPRSTLLCLVSALCGRERVLDAYREAVARQYRFYSYGDAMLLWNKDAIPRPQ